MDILFYKHDLASTLDNHSRKLREHVNKLVEDYVLGASEDDLVAYLEQEFSLDPPVLGEPFVADSEEVDIDVSHDPLRSESFPVQHVQVKGLQVHIKVPFTGDGSLFWFRPSHFTLSPPRGVVTKEYLEFYIRGESLIGESIKQNLDATLREIQGYLSDITERCNAHNLSLDQKIREVLRIRKERL